MTTATASPSFRGGGGVDGCGDGGKELTYSVLYKLERVGLEIENGELWVLALGRLVVESVAQG